MAKPELVKRVRELERTVNSAQRRVIQAVIERDMARAMRWTDNVRPDVDKPTEPGVIVHAWHPCHVPPYVEPVWVTSTRCGYGHPKTIEESQEDPNSRLGYHPYMYSTEVKALTAQRHRMVSKMSFELLGLDERLEKLQQ